MKVGVRRLDDTLAGVPPPFFFLALGSVVPGEAKPTSVFFG